MPTALHGTTKTGCFQSATVQTWTNLKNWISSDREDITVFLINMGMFPRAVGVHIHPPKKAPAGLSFNMPIANLGPAAGGNPDSACYTFNPNSAPGGMIWCGSGFPPMLRNSFLIARFGNMIDCPQDVGFDLISAKMEQKPDGVWQTRVNKVIAPLGRPIDVHATGSGHILILEYTRPTNHKGKIGWLPGRILELAPTN